MVRPASQFQIVVAAALAACAVVVTPATIPAAAQPAAARAPVQPPAPADLDALFAELRAPEAADAPGAPGAWRRAESDILRAWSHSGSAALDLLRQRGEAALDAGDAQGAIGHLTALTDHAPDYAQGFQLRATAYAMAGEYGPAAADLARALTLEPRQFVALTQLGAMLEEMGSEDRALAAFEASLAIHPHQQEAIDAVDRLSAARDGTSL